MKKLIAGAAVVGLLVVLGASGYTAEAQGLTAKGVKLGLNIATMAGDDVPSDAKSKVGVALGGFATYSINDMFAVQPELLYTMKGYAQTYGTEDYTMSYNYLELPILGKLNVPVQGDIKPNVFLGPAFALKLASSYSDGHSGDIEDVNSLDVGLVIGVGADMPAGTGRIGADIRYNMGLTNVDGSDAKAKASNSVISIMVGYSF